MQIVNYVRAKILHSSTAACKLAKKNQDKYLPFAEKLIAVKNLDAHLKLKENKSLDEFISAREKIKKYNNLMLVNFNKSTLQYKGFDKYYHRADDFIVKFKELNAKSINTFEEKNETLYSHNGIKYPDPDQYSVSSYTSTSSSWKTKFGSQGELTVRKDYDSSVDNQDVLPDISSHIHKEVSPGDIPAGTSDKHELQAIQTLAEEIHKARGLEAGQTSLYKTYASANSLVETSNLNVKNPVSNGKTDSTLMESNA